MTAEIIVDAERDLYTDTEWTEMLEGQHRIVRCRDCRHYVPINIGTERYCKVWARKSPICPDDGYCHWGER